jgi:phosphopantothenoylcysteine synthetase/decarboxylase
LIENAKNKLEKVNMDWLLANDVSEKNNVFNGDDNTIVFFNKSNIENWKKMSKMDVANKLSNLISEYFE